MRCNAIINTRDMSSVIICVSMCVQIRIAYAQIGRKLFSYSDDNVAFPRRRVISLRDLNLYDDSYFFPLFLIILTFMGVYVCLKFSPS